MRLKRKLFYFFFLFFFSITVNQYYGYIGVFPIDSFLFFDTGHRTLNGYLPVKDFWINSGFLIDIIQAIFFKIFGVSWFSYVLHASIFNFLLAAATFFTLSKFDLNINLSFFYSILVAVLAYPTSGTPFLDHHSMIFSLIAMYSFILSIKEKSNLYWFSTPILITLGFLSKQTPASYIGLIIIVVSIFYFIFYFDIKKIIISFLGAASITLILFLYIIINNVGFYSLIEQLILFPMSIGGDRFENFIFPFEFNRVILRFKLIHLSQLILILIIIKNTYKNLNYLKSSEFFILITIVFSSFAFIAHQLLTLNQKFIFSIIPILLGFSHSYYKKKFKNSLIVVFLLVSLGISSTIYYKISYLDNRKFMEMENINLNKSINAKIIDEKFKNLKWINPVFKGDPNNEIKLLKESIKIIKNDKRKKILATHYQFLYSMVGENTYSPNRTYTSNGISYPLKDNKNFSKYKKFFVNQILKNHIKVIYTIRPISKYIYLDILEKECVEISRENEILYSHKILDCDSLN